MLNDINLNGTPGAKVFFTSETIATGLTEISAELVTAIDGAVGGIIIDAGGNVFAITGLTSSGSLMRVQYVTTLAGTGGGGGGKYKYHKTYTIHGYITQSSSWGSVSAYTYWVMRGTFSVYSNSDDISLSTMQSDILDCYGTQNRFSFSGIMQRGGRSSSSSTYTDYEVLPIVSVRWNGSGLYVEYLPLGSYSDDPSSSPSFTSLTVDACTVVEII